MSRILPVVAIVFAIAVPSQAEEQHPLAKDLPPAADVLWDILFDDVPAEERAEVPSGKEFAAMVLEGLAEMGDLPPDLRTKLLANKAVRPVGEYDKQIDKFPDEEVWKARKEKLRRWYADKTRTPRQKEAMFLLLQFIVPSEPEANKSE